MRAVTGSTALRFRAATPADVPAIVALVESAYRGDSSRAGWTTEADLMATIVPHPTMSESMHEAVLAAYGRALHI